MLFLNQNTRSNATLNGKHEVFIDSLLEVPADLRAFCRLNGVRVYNDMMQHKFVGLRKDLETIVVEYIAPASESTRRRLLAQISPTI